MTPTNQITAPSSRRSVRIAYWVVTSLLCLNLFAGILDILLVDAIRQSTRAIGFPLTIAPLLGSLKIMGAIVLLFVKDPILKIAAYAGVIFYFIGAVFAHLTIGQPVEAALPAFVSLALAVGSYWLWRNLANLRIIAGQPTN